MDEHIERLEKFALASAMEVKDPLEYEEEEFARFDVYVNVIQALALCKIEGHLAKLVGLKDVEVYPNK